MLVPMKANEGNSEKGNQVGTARGSKRGDVDAHLRGSRDARLRCVAAAAGGEGERERERCETRREQRRGEAGRQARAPWLWRWRSSESSSSNAKGGELHGSRGGSSRSCCGARSLPRLVAGSRGGDVGASRCRQGWRPSLRPRWHSTNGRHPTPSHQHHHVLVRHQSAPGAVAFPRDLCVCDFSLSFGITRSKYWS